MSPAMLHLAHFSPLHSITMVTMMQVTVAAKSIQRSHKGARVPAVQRAQALTPELSFFRLFLEAEDDAELSSSTSSSGLLFKRLQLVAMIPNRCRDTIRNLYI